MKTNHLFTLLKKTSEHLLSDLFGHYCGFAPRRSFCEMWPWVTGGGRRGTLGLRGRFYKAEADVAEREREGRHEKHDLYYCGLLLLFGGGQGKDGPRHFYEEGR